MLKRPKKILVRKAKSCLILACKRKLCVRLIAVSKRAKRRKRKHPSCPAPFLSWIPPIMHHSYSVSLFCPSFLLSFKPPVLHLSNPICLLPSCPVFLPHVLPYICLFCIHPVLHTVHCTVYTLSCTASVLPPFCLASFLNCFNPVLISECPASDLSGLVSLQKTRRETNILRKRSEAKERKKVCLATFRFQAKIGHPVM